MRGGDATGWSCRTAIGATPAIQLRRSREQRPATRASASAFATAAFWGSQLAHGVPS